MVKRWKKGNVAVQKEIVGGRKEDRSRGRG